MVPRRFYFIHDAQGDRRREAQDFPLAIGGADNAGIVIPGVSADALLAWIGLSEGHAFLQPADPSVVLFHNQQRITKSAWLKSGDQIEVGDARIRWTAREDQVHVHVAERQPDQPQLVPPALPPGTTADKQHDLPVAVRHMPSRGGRLRQLLIVAFTLLLLAIAWLTISMPVHISITPAAEQLSLQGAFPALHIGDRYLALPGRYRLLASREGYQPLDTELLVSRAGPQAFRYRLAESPGVLRLALKPDVEYQLFVDGQPLAATADGSYALERGQRQLRIVTARYLTVERQLEIEGFGHRQPLDIELEPAWASALLDSEPPGAEVWVDGVAAGRTPLQTELLQGTRDIRLQLDGYQTATLQQQVRAGQPVQIERVRLQPVDGQVQLATTPVGAAVSVDDRYLGTTPVTLQLSSTDQHELRLSKQGYQTDRRALRLEPGEVRQLSVTLKAEYGTVFVTTTPADAELLLDGQPLRRDGPRLRLPARPHRLQVVRDGYVSRTVTITPRAGISENVDITLDRATGVTSSTAASGQGKSLPATITTAVGQTLHLVRPAAEFQMGASRREAGRRANESRRQVRLERPFYFAETEVTNGEYRRYRPQHDAGSAEGVNLDGDRQPVVNVSWHDAARFCNWLSEQDGLPPAYREVNEAGKSPAMELVRPLTTGYRMPTEAEWAYVARVLGREDPARYPWAGSYPPTTVSGNFADRSIADTLATVVPGYDDGFRATAPVGSFTPSPSGYYDLGGNVAEWMSDYYAVYPGVPGQPVSDPNGPPAGDHHVVRGSSWRQGNITELRFSYRDYSRRARDDLGFRVARYAR